MNVLIPMAGNGKRFFDKGHIHPKPLVQIHDQPMIELVVKNLDIDGRYIFIVQESHYHAYNLNDTLQKIKPGCEIIRVNGVTEGAACTTLLAKDLINNDDELVIANSDQFVEWNSSTALENLRFGDAGILTFRASDPKWSYAKLNASGYVVEVAEKRPLSNIATVGVYYWKHGKDYVSAANRMIDKNLRVNNEFYVCPVFNEAIAAGLKVTTFDVDRMWGLGTPEDLDYFLDNYKK